jgi:two-component system chemotaxis sensor kinase CheA
LTQRVDLKEFLSAYLAEVDEQLQLANAKLLEIEAAARRGEASPRAVRDLFRSMHTVKGLSAMVGVEPAVAIAHRMESVLRVADQGGGRIAAESVDVLLRAVRAIEHRVRELADGKPPSPPPAAILEALDLLEPSTASPRSPTKILVLDPAIAAKLAPFERQLLEDAALSGRRAMRANFSPSPAKAERGLSINAVRERVASIAEIVKVVPVSVPASEDAPGALSFALLVLTSASDEDLAAAVGVAVETLSALAAAQPNDGALPEASAGQSSLAPLDDPEDESAKPQRRNIVRVDVSRLDDAMEHLSTLIVTRSRLARAIAELAAAGVNTRDLKEIMRINTRQLRDLRAAILRVRMVPMVEVLERIPLIVRGLRRESGKQVRLKIDAGDTEMDKGVAERLFPAIVHLVRNAVDHAIETRDVRARAGKPEEGTLRISCVAQSNTRLELLVSDDGAGVDRGAVERRVGHELPDNAAALLEALCQAGMSTKAEATTTSGRGMGMDIVKRIVVDQLGGELAMTTARGVGTTFAMRVPLTIAIVDAFTMDCQRHRFVVPVSMVEEILEVDRAKVRFGPSRRPSGRRGPDDVGRPAMIERRGETVPLIDLASVLNIRQSDVPARQALVVRRGGEPIAFGLDKVLGQEEAVVRPLVDPLVQVPGVSGATDLGDGKPTLVLDLVALGATLASRAGGRAA